MKARISAQSRQRKLVWLRLAQSFVLHDEAMVRAPIRLGPAFGLLLALSGAAHAQPEEDAEHRADRLRTIELNRRAQSVVDRRDGANADVRETNRRALEKYERDRAEWRRRVAACRAGDYSACGS